MSKSPNKNIHDSIFDFLFNLQRTKKTLSNIKPDPKNGELGNSLLELGTQPALYPIGTTMEEIKKIMENATAVQLGNEQKLSTSPFTPPSQISKQIKKEREKKQGNRMLTLWSSIGGNLDTNGDAALLSMFAKKFDLSGDEAIELGKFYKNIKKEESKLVMDKAMWGKRFLPSQKDKDFPDLDIEYLGEEYRDARFKKKEEIISKGQDILLEGVLKDVKGKQTFTKQREEEIHKATHGKDRGTWRDKDWKFTKRDTPGARLNYTPQQIEERRKEMEKELSERDKKERTEEEIEQLREEEIQKATHGQNRATWRDNKSRFTRRDAPGAHLHYSSQQVEDAREEMEEDLEFKRRILDPEIKKEDIFRILTDTDITTEEEREEALFSYFQDRGIEDKYSNLYTNHLLKQNPQIWNNLDPAFLKNNQESIYKALAFRIVSERMRDENIQVDDIQAEVARVENELRTFMNTKRSNYSVRLQRALLMKRFIDSSSNFNNILLSGEWEKFETQGLGFTQIVKRVDVYEKDADGKIILGEDGQPILIGSYFTQGGSVMGKLLGKTYYLHPKNLMNGMFNTGDLWLKLACGEDGKLNKKSLGYAFYNLTPGRTMKKALQNISKPLNSVARGIREKFLNPIMQKFMRAAKRFLKKFLKATGVGGLIAENILNFLDDRIEAFIIQTVQIFFIAIAGIIIAIFFSIGPINNSENTALLNNHTEVSQGNTFTDFDWELANK